VAVFVAMARRARTAALLLGSALLLTGCGTTGSGSDTSPRSTPGNPSGTPSATAKGTPSPCDVKAQKPPGGTIPANYATALAFAPDGRLFWAERSGTVAVWQNGAAHPFATVTTVTTEAGGGYSERGLLGLAISPTFSSDHFVYAFYSDANRTEQHVIRWNDCAGVSSKPKVLVTLPSGADCCHKGGRIAFGADGKLYVTLGEEHTAGTAQNKNDVRGKILRYNPDGSVPSDNPFGAQNPVWAYGLRNPFGIAVAANGQMAVSSNGPSGDDGSPRTGYDIVALNVTRGEGFQWPLCYGYSHPLEQSGCGGLAAPDWSSEAGTVVPTGMTFVDAKGPMGTAGTVAVCTFTKGMLLISAGTPHASVSTGPADCLLDVVQGPDHALYYSSTHHIYRMG
jgi:glucose/arabinose dehydrogenase